MQKLLLVGGGGHCESIIDSLMSQPHDYTQIAIIDRKEKLGQSIRGIPIIGIDEDLPALFERGFKYAFVSLGSVGNPIARKRIWALLKKIGYAIPTIIDSTAVISTYSKINSGVYVGKNSVVNTGVVIGENSIINTGSIVEHDCILGKCVHLAPGCVVCGGTNIGDNVHIGANATIIQGLDIANDVIVGAGAVVINDIISSCTVVGNPGRIVR